MADMAPPVAIGGLGGSGTRVFADLLRRAGVDIGPCLNRQLDNLWFTVLFKRASWLERAPDTKELEIAARLFRRAMTRGLAEDLRSKDRELIYGLGKTLPPEGDWRCGARGEHADDLLNSRRDRPPCAWGWKEPNTHIFLPTLNKALPGLRYIHVVRDGLDMAFSSNTQQTRNWGHLFGLPMTQDVPLPLRQLRYWLRANQTAMDYGDTAMPNRFLVMSYEAFCTEPEQHWHRALGFLDLPAVPLPDNLSVQPTTIGRSKEYDTTYFDPADLIALKTLSRELEKRSVATVRG